MKTLFRCKVWLHWKQIEFTQIVRRTWTRYAKLVLMMGFFALSRRHKKSHHFGHHQICDKVQNRNNSLDCAKNVFERCKLELLAQVEFELNNKQVMLYLAERYDLHIGGHRWVFHNRFFFISPITHLQLFESGPANAWVPTNLKF